MWRQTNRSKLKVALLSIPILTVMLMVVFAKPILRRIGQFVISDETPAAADAVLVLNTGTEYYPRLLEAAEIYGQGLASTVIINGNRKTESLRRLESEGFRTSCPWYADSLGILNLKGVPAEAVVPLSVEDAYDTVSEAKAVGEELIRRGFSRIIITTSKYHSRRARHIWRRMYAERLSIWMVSAKTDPFDPEHWWRDGRQIRWVLAEYGAWVFYGYKQLCGAF